MSKTTHRGRDIPWTNIVQFHKDVVARAESGFFSLNGKDDQAERWTSLPNFLPTDLAGPWTLDRDDIHSQPFRLALEQGNHSSVFLGGPGFLGFDRPYPNSKWLAQWRPLLYREVEIKPQGSTFSIIPKSGIWGVTPLLYSQLDRLEVTLDRSLEEIATALIEKAASIQKLEQTPLANAILDAFSREIPAIEETLTRVPKQSDFGVPPSPWVLFAPVNDFSALIRHLMADYEKLEALLEENPNELGGLQILEDIATPTTQSPSPILPLVPLNPHQESAVQAILAGKPLTVISGPPGTGKSQVVVSLLLNAWAQGKSVLFASNNNKAVDVVRERVERFESEFPIAVRAGARTKQNIQEVLRRTMNMAGSGNGQNSSALNAKRLRKAQDKLKKQRSQFESDLESKLPQRIDESRKTALDAYGNYRRSIADIHEAEMQLTKQREDLELHQSSLESVKVYLEETNSWLSDVQTTEEQIRTDNTERAQHNADAIIQQEIRNQSAASAGLSPEDAGDWSWLTSGPSPGTLEAWLAQASGLLEQPLETILEPFPWETDYDSWSDSKSAKQWHLESADFDTNTRQNLAVLGPKLQSVSTLADQRASHATQLDSEGIPQDVEIPPEIIHSWNAAHAELVTHTPAWFDFLPWSQVQRLRRCLKSNERRVRSMLPVSIWERLGPLDSVTRRHLSNIFSLVDKWQKLNLKWENARATIEEIESSFSSMRSTAGRLGLRDIPSQPDIQQWEHTVELCHSHSDLALSAASAWKKREEQELVQSQLRTLSRNWQSLASGLPLREAWQQSKGLSFEASISKLRETQSADNLRDFRRLLYTGIAQELLQIWEACLQAQRSYMNFIKAASLIPSEPTRISTWLSQRPRNALGPEPTYEEWPGFDSIHSYLGSVSQHLESSHKFHQTEKPSQELEAAEELKWALDRLDDACSIVPDTEARATLTNLFKRINLAPKNDWPVEELNSAFAEFSPERIRAHMDRIDAQLERGSFEDAKARWLERLQHDDESVRAVDHLERMLASKKVINSTNHASAFRDALRSVPIWITTAQAAQAIPLEPSLFDIVVIDEASQCTLTNLLPLMYRGKSLAVIGDDQQLPAIPNIQESEQLAIAKKHGVEEHMLLFGHVNNDVYKTASESLPRRRADVHLLTEHFRSHPLIIGFSNRHIYLQRLELKKDPQWGKRLPIGSGVHSIDISGAVTRGSRGRSWVNEIEANRVFDLVKELRNSDIRKLSIGIVTPFAAHKSHLRDMLDSAGLASQTLVDTAYGFQGDERDVIIFSPVVSKGITETASRWVESPPNLINVALTRAREALFVVGDLDYCMQQDGILRQLAMYCDDIETMRETSEAELELFSWMTVKGWVPDVHPNIGDIEVDFALRSDSGVRLIVEVDGMQHEGTIEQDKARDAFLQGQGFIVFRVTAREVLQTPFEVIHKIEILLDG